MRLLLLYLLPKNLLSRFVGFLANRRISCIAIRPFAAAYKLNMNEAALPISAYKTLNALFTRRLKAGMRPIEAANDSQAVVSPVDGVLVQYGQIQNGKLIQVKNKDYALSALLNSEEEARVFEGGHYLTIYLAPVDYHRIHHYADGEIEGYSYVPGALFPVNNFSVARIKNLFCINERVVTYIRHKNNRSALVKVGATIVGKIKVAYDSITSNCGGKASSQIFKSPIPVKKGDDLGLFEMGSTVVLIFEPGAFIGEALAPGRRLHVGMKIGVLS